MLLRVRNTLIAVMAVAGLTAGAAATASAFTSGTSTAPALVASASPPVTPVTGEPEPIPTVSAEPEPIPTVTTDPEPEPTATSCPAPTASSIDTVARAIARAIARAAVNAGPCTSEYDLGGAFKASVTPEDKKLTIRFYSLNNTCQIDSISTTFLVGQKPQNATIEDKADPNQGKGRSWIFDHTQVNAGVNVKIRLLVKYTCNGTKDEFTWTFLWNTTGNVNVFSPQ